MVQQLSEPFDPLMSHPAALEKRRYALSPLQAIAVCTRRQAKLVLRDKVLLKGRMLQVRVTSLLACVIACGIMCALCQPGICLVGLCSVVCRTLPVCWLSVR